MFVGPVVGSLLCTGAGVAWPLVRARRAQGDVAERWLAFFACAALSALPLAILLPTWWPLRYEAILALLLVLGASDARGAQVVYVRWVAGRLDHLASLAQGVSLDVCMETVEGVFRQVPPPDHLLPTGGQEEEEEEHESDDSPPSPVSVMEAPS